MSLRPVLRALALLPALLPGLGANPSAQERVDVSGLPMVVGHGTVGFVVYKGPATPSSFWRCFDGLGYSSIGEVADEVHMLQAGDLSSFTIAYHVEGEAGDAGDCTALVTVYANDASDSSAPPADLLGSYTITDLPWTTETNHTFTYDLPVPLAVPRDLWVGVEIVAPPGAHGSMLFASPNEAEYDGIPSQSAAPTVGSSHDLTWFGPASCTPSPTGELVNNADYFGITLNHTFALRILLDVNCPNPIPNGDFETAAAAPWSGVGQYGVAIAEVAGVVPPSGAYQGFADTVGLYPAGRLLLELAAGRPIAELDAMTSGGPIAHGSLLTQTLTVAAGDVLSFKWNFLTNEVPGQPFKNDSAFFLANGPAPLTVHLADTFSAFAPSTSLVFASETGYQAFSASFAVGGTYTLVFGAVDRFDAADDSVLLVDCVERVSGPPTNQAPSCSADLSLVQADFLEVAPGAFVVTAGSTLVVPFTGTDADGDPLMVALSGVPMGATIAPVSGATPLTSTLTWTPGTWDKSGAPWTLAVSFTDPSGASSSCEVTVADVNLPPECTASSQTVESSSPAGALVTLDGAATDADDLAASLVYQWFVSDAGVVLDDPSSPTPTGTFPVGVTMATLTVADGRGGIDACDVLITVVDTSAPEVMVTTDKALLWPPKHAMLPVTISILATDACSDPDEILPITVRVSSSEPDDAQGNGDGSTRGDVNGLDGYATPVDVTSGFCYDAGTGLWTGTVRLRAERGGTGHGRKYTIDVQAMDSNGNASTTSCCVVVPHDRRADCGPD
jgi:hypothetical protein